MIIFDDIYLMKKTSLFQILKKDIKVPIEIVKNCVERGDDINKAYKSGITALHHCCKVGNLKICEELLKYGGDIDLKDNLDKTPLFYAVEGGYKKIVDLIANKEKRDLNKKKEKYQTVLIIASEKGKRKLILNSIKKGGKINKCQNENELTSLMFAVKYQQIKTVKLLLKNQANIEAIQKNGWNVLMIASVEGFKDFVRLLIIKGSNIEKREKVGGTALMIAALKGNNEIINLLSKFNASINSKCNFGGSVLMYACQNGHSETVKLLLEKKVNKNTYDNFERNAMHLASKNGHTEVIKLLLENGFDIDKRNINGKTALFFACENGYAETAEFLIKKGADKNSKNFQNTSILEVASQKGYDEIVKLLK